MHQSEKSRRLVSVSLEVRGRCILTPEDNCDRDTGGHTPSSETAKNKFGGKRHVGNAKSARRVHGRADSLMGLLSLTMRSRLCCWRSSEGDPLHSKLIRRLVCT